LFLVVEKYICYLEHKVSNHLYRVYCETMNEIHSYITSCKRGYLTQAELFRYYRQQEHDNAEIPYHLLGFTLLSSNRKVLFHLL
jgi:hypothetical protein